jgi:hypothetical protein
MIKNEQRRQRANENGREQMREDDGKDLELAVFFFTIVFAEGSSSLLCNHVVCAWDSESC